MLLGMSPHVALQAVHVGRGKVTAAAPIVPESGPELEGISLYRTSCLTVCVVLGCLSSVYYSVSAGTAGKAWRATLLPWRLFCCEAQSVTGSTTFRDAIHCVAQMDKMALVKRRALLCGTV